MERSEDGAGSAGSATASESRRRSSSVCVYVMRGLCNGGVEGLDEGEPGFPDGVQGVFMPSPAHGQIIVHGKNHGVLLHEAVQGPGQRAFPRAGGSVEQDDAPQPRLRLLRVVSWKEAAEMKDSVLRDALVIPIRI